MSRKKVDGLMHYRAMVFSRFVLALVGGYGVAAFLAKWIAMVSTQPPASAAMLGTLLGFLIYTGIFIWVFAVRSTVKAWGSVAVIFAVVSLGYFLQVR